MARQQQRRSVAPTGPRIREAMEAHDLTSDDLARLVGVNVRLVQKWRAGSTIPSFTNLKRLEKVLGKPVSWFFSEEAEAVA